MLQMDSVVKRVQWHGVAKERDGTVAQALAGGRELVGGMRCWIWFLLEKGQRNLFLGLGLSLTR